MTLAAAAAALLLLPAAAGAQTYPEPKEPGKIAPKPKGPFATHTVCKKGTLRLPQIQKAVNKAEAGDKIAVRKGVYREAVTITGAQALPADRRRPQQARRVVLEGSARSRTASSSTAPTR